MSNLACDQPILNVSALNTIPDFLNGLLYEPWEWIVYQCFLPLIISFGVISNILFMYTVIWTPSLRTATYMYLINLSIADIMTLLGLGIPVVTNYHLSPVKGDEIPALFYIRQTGSYIFYGASVSFVTLVSFERFLAICYPIRHRIMKGNQRTIKLIIITWIISSVLAVQIFFFESTNVCIVWPKLPSTDNFPIQITLFYFNFNYTSTCIFALLFWCLTLFANVFMYAKLYIALNNRKRNLGTLNSSMDNQDQLRQVAFMIIINGSVFYCCCAGQMIYQILLVIVSADVPISTNYPRIMLLSGLAMLLTLLFNASINPTLYFITNRQYRHEFTAAMRRLLTRTCTHTDTNDLQTSNDRNTTPIVISSKV